MSIEIIFLGYLILVLIIFYYATMYHFCKKDRKYDAELIHSLVNERNILLRDEEKQEREEY